MAIIGKFPEVMRFFQHSIGYEIIKNYLEQSLLKGSETNQRLYSLPIGSFEKFDIKDRYFAVEQKFLSKNRSDCFFESHIKHIDIQLMVDGEELMETLHKSHLKLKDDYSFERDLIVYHNNADSHKVLLKNGDLAVFFPEDAHMGTQKYQESTTCVKTVIKMPLEFFRL